jgi:hypothetical protein
MPSKHEDLVASAIRKLEEANITPRCQHIKVDGSRCGSPAMRQRKFCYYHLRAAVQSKRLEMPLLEDAPAVQLGIMRVCNAIANGTLDSKKAGLLLYGLQTASCNLRLAVETEPDVEDLVRDRHCNTYGDEVAEEEAQIAEIKRTAEHQRQVAEQRERETLAAKRRQQRDERAHLIAEERVNRICQTLRRNGMDEDFINRQASKIALITASE